MRRSPPGATASPTPPRPSCAAPWPGWPTRRACTSTWPRAASSTSRSRPVSPPERLILHGNNKSADELATALRARRRPHRHRLLRRDRPPGRHCWSPPHPDSERPKVLVRVTPGVEAHTHEFVRTGQEDSKFGFSVSSGAAAEAVAALELMPGVELVGVHAHIGSQVFEASSFEQAAEVLGAFFAPLGLPELVVGGGLGVPYVNGESAPTQAAWAEATRRACAQAGVSPGHEDHGRARAFHRGHGGHDAVHGRDREAPPRDPHLRQRRRRHERQPAARPLRERVRGLPAACRRGAPPATRAGGGQALRERGPRGARGVRSRRPRGGRRAGHPGHRCLRVRHGLQLQQGAPPGCRLRRRRRGPGGGPPGDASTTSPASTPERDEATHCRRCTLRACRCTVWR